MKYYPRDIITEYTERLLLFKKEKPNDCRLERLYSALKNDFNVDFPRNIDIWIDFLTKEKAKFDSMSDQDKTEYEEIIYTRMNDL